jgi:UDP-glucose 4-epimerase
MTLIHPMNTGDRVLVTGGSGFVGSHLVTSLLQQGHRVTVVDNMSTGRAANLAQVRDHPSLDVVTGDILDGQVLDALMRRSDVVFHLAAAVGVHMVVEDALGTIQTNVLGTEAVLAAALRHEVRVLLASTSEVYGKCVTLPASEDDDVLLGASRNSRWSYAASKLVDEFLGLAYHRQHGLPVTIFRLFNTVGPRQSGRYGMVIPRFVEAALSGRPLPVHGDGSQSRSFCHVDDAVAGIISLAAVPAAVGEVFNIGGSLEISIGDLAATVLEQTKHLVREPGGIEYIPYAEAYAAGFEDIRRRVADTTKIRQLTGWEPKQLLRDIIEDVVGDVVGTPDGGVVVHHRRRSTAGQSPRA